MSLIIYKWRRVTWNYNDNPFKLLSHYWQVRMLERLRPLRSLSECQLTKKELWRGRLMVWIIEIGNRYYSIQQLLSELWLHLMYENKETSLVVVEDEDRSLMDPGSLDWLVIFLLNIEDIIILNLEHN